MGRKFTRKLKSGSCRRIAPCSWAFRRCSPADPAVRPSLHLGAHAAPPAVIRPEPVEGRSATRKRTRLGAAGVGGCKSVPLGATRKKTSVRTKWVAASVDTSRYRPRPDTRHPQESVPVTFKPHPVSKPGNEE